MFGSFRSLLSVQRNPSRLGASAGEQVTRLDPVGANLPEKRSDVRELGDLKTGAILNLLAPQSASGANVNEGSALGVAAVFACVRLISDMVAKLPLELYQKTEKGPVRIEDHPGATLMARMPSDLHTSFDLRKLMMSGKGLGGDGYARIYRDNFGTPYSIQWLKPCDVEPMAKRKPNGECVLAYKVTNGDTNEELSRYDVIHIRGESRDGISGVSPVTLMRESIGTALSQTQAAGRLIKNGAKFPGFLTTDARLNPDQLNDARDEFNAKYAGAINSGAVPVLNGGWDFKATNGMSMVDAQFIESRRFELQEVARHYGIPSHLIGDSTASTTWGTGIQEQTLGFLNFCLDPHLINFEQSLDASLLTTEELRSGYYFRFDRDELASVSRQDTAAYFTAMRNMGVYSVNDIRAKLDEPAIPADQGGDEYRLPLNSSTSSTPAKEEKPETVEA